MLIKGYELVEIHKILDYDSTSVRFKKGIISDAWFYNTWQRHF